MIHKMNIIVKLGNDITEKWNETSVIYKFNCHKRSSVYVHSEKFSFEIKVIYFPQKDIPLGLKIRSI